MKENLKSYLGGEIAIFVSTYHKYNEGTISGAWVNLEKVSDVKEFYQVCRELHSDERDPEYMYQDVEGLPSWMGRESMGAEAIAEAIEYAHATPAERARIACDDAEDEEPDETPKYQIIDYSEKAIAVTGDTKPIAADLKKLGGRFNSRLSCGPGWIFPAKKREALESLLNASGATSAASSGPAPKPAPKHDDKALLDEYIAEISKVWTDKSMQDYFRKEFSSAVRLENDGIVMFEKPRIDTQFCFGYSHDMTGEDERKASEAAHAAATKEDYFLAENLRGWDDEINALEKGCRDLNPADDYYCKTWYITRAYDNKDVNIYSYHAYRDWDVQERPSMYTNIVSKMSDTDRQTILEALKHEKDKFEKRLNAYLKRYGTSKLRTWTYWRDE